MTDLMNLIDDYAEARHCAGHASYNMKTYAARDAVVSALGQPLPLLRERASEHILSFYRWCFSCGLHSWSSPSRFELSRRSSWRQRSPEVARPFSGRAFHPHQGKGTKP